MNWAASDDTTGSPRGAYPLRFQFGLSEGYQTDRYPASSIPLVQQSGAYQVTSRSSTGPVTYPGGSFVVATTSPTGDDVHLHSQSWEDQHRLHVLFAPQGVDHPGWRFSVGTAWEVGAIKESLGSPLTSPAPNIQLSATPATSCVILSVFTGQCALFGLSVPFTRTVFQAPGVFNTPTQTQISTYDLTQQNRRFSIATGIDRAFDLQTPWGVLDVTLGAETRGGWRSLTDVRTVAALQEGPDTALTDIYRTDVDGPTVSASAKLSVGGQMPGIAPLTWRIFGDAGSEWASLDVQNGRGQSVRLRGTNPIAGIGAEFQYRVRPDIGLTLGGERRRTVEVSSMLSPATVGGVTLNDGSGVFVNFRDLNSWVYRVGATYSF